MATAKENLEDFITCSVCLEKFEGRDPRLLPCGHAFCLTCIQDIHRTARTNKDIKLKDDEFRCPQCATVSFIPRKSVNNFPRFYHATHIHKMIHGNNPKTCANDDRELRSYCFTCTKTFCDECFRGHNKNRRYNNHVHVEVTTDSIEALVCSVHDEMVEAFCTDCCKAVCAHCQVSDHTDHSISDFVISQQRPDTPQQEILEKQQDGKDNIQKIELMQDEFNAHVSDIQDEITKQTKMLISQIIDQTKALQAELSKHKEDTNRELENMKKRYRELDDMITQAEAQIAQLTQPIPELASVSLQNLDELISDIQQQIPQTLTGMKDVTRYQFTPQTTDVLLGYLTEVKLLHNVKLPVLTHETQAPSTSPCPTEEFSEPSGGAATPRPVPAARSPQPLSGAAYLTEPELLTHIYTGHKIFDISWTPAGEVLVVGGDKGLLMYNTCGEKLPASCNVSGVKGLVCSAATHHPNSTVALVTWWGGYNDLHLYITSMGKGRKARYVCELPGLCELAKFTVGGDVLVYDQDMLFKYNTKGTKLWARRTKHQIRCITSTLDNKIIISGEQQMSMLDKDGRWLSTFPRDKSTLLYPTGVCIDSRGHVFVADAHNEAVFMYTSDGTYVREVVRVDGQPRYLALYQDKYLAVEGLWGKIPYDIKYGLCVYNISS